MKRVLAVLAGLAVLTACTAGGNGDSGKKKDSKGNVTLTFLTFETPNLTGTYWDEAIARASAQVPGVKIKKLVTPNVDRTTYAKQLAASGQLPDVMIAVTPTGFAQAGQLAAFDPSELTSFENPTANAINGKVYQLPWASQPQPMVYYNKAKFAQAGITTTPTTWAQFLDVCAKLKAKGITPIEIGGGGSDTWADSYTLMGTVATEVYKSDPTWIKELNAGQAKFSDPPFVKAAQKVADLAKNGYLDKAGLSRTYANTEQAFRDGKAAMYPMGNWFAASADAKKPPFDVGVFAWPTDDGSLVMPTFTGGGLSVSAKAPDVALAKKWALAFSSNKTNLDNEVKADGVFIAIKGYTPPSDVGQTYQDSVALYNKAVQAKGVVNAFTAEGGDDAVPAGVLPDVFTGIADLINGRKTPAQLASFLDKSMSKAKK
jgi:multiple sugar transport system substrate-binding protein